MFPNLRYLIKCYLCCLVYLTGNAQACPIVGAVELSQLVSVTTEYPFIENGSQPNEFSFIEPMGVAISNHARIYILDSENSKVRISTLEGKQLKYFGKVGNEAGMFVAPKGLAIDENDDIYIADSGNNRIQRFDKTGRFLFAWGSYGYAQQQLINPTGIAVDQQFVYVVDTGKNRVVVFQKNGTFVRTFGQYGAGDKDFNQPVGIATDGYGNLFIADSQNDKIKHYSRDGKFYKAWGARGSLPGQLNSPFGVAYAKGLLYVAELGNHRIQIFRENGKFQAPFGNTPETLNALDIRLHYPASIAVSPNGKYTVACQPLLVRCQSTSGKQIIASTTMEDSARWELGVTQFQYGSGVAVDNGLLAALYPEEHSVLLFDATTNQPELLTQVGGYGSHAGQFKNPSSVIIDGQRNLLYIGDAHNHRVQVFDLIRDQDNKLQAVKLKIAIGSYGSAEGEFNEPAALVKTDRGDLLVLDRYNNRVQLITDNWQVKIDHAFEQTSLDILSFVPNFTAQSDNLRYYWIDPYESKIVTTKNHTIEAKLGIRNIAGRKRQEQVDRMVMPSGIALDEHSNIYTTDEVAQKIMKFNAKGILVSQWGAWGDKPAEFYKPKNLTVDTKTKRIFVVDFGNNRIQIFDYDGKILGMFGIGHGKDIVAQKIYSLIRTK